MKGSRKKRVPPPSPVKMCEDGCNKPAMRGGKYCVSHAHYRAVGKQIQESAGK